MTLAKNTVVIVTVAIIIWDVLLNFYLKTDHASLTEFFREYAKEQPIISFSFGLLMGHLFWNK